MTFDYNGPMNIGGMSAEQEDSKFLHDNFVDIPIDALLRDDNSRIILGRKGSGKSALKKHFNNFHDDGKIVVGFSPSNGEIIALLDYISSPGSTNLTTSFAQQIWQASFLLSLTSRAFTNSTRRRLPDASISSIIKQYNDYVDKEGLDVSFARTIACLKKCEINVTDVPDLCSKLDRALTKITDDQETKYYFVVDSIDDELYSEFDLTKRDNYFSIYFDSLISFFRDFVNKKICTAQENFSLKIFLPTDAYMTSVNRHHDHIKNFVKELLWSPNEMEKFILKRLSTNIELVFDGTNANQIWEKFLPTYFEQIVYHDRFRSTRKRRLTKDVVMELTLNRPRDLIDLFLQIHDKTMGAENVSFPSQKILEDAFSSYSHSIRTSVETEYEKILPEICRILGGFADNYSRIDKSVLRQNLQSSVSDHKSIDRIVKILFDANIIGAVREKPSTIFEKKIETFYRSEMKDFYTFWNHEMFEIHPGFRDSLGVHSSA